MLSKKQLLAALFALSGTLAFANDGNRGIGVYPGNPAETFHPAMVKDNQYRNVALFRAAFASSSADHNLTPQLITDGHTINSPAPFLKVTTGNEVLDLRNKLKTFDGNIHSYNVVMGENGALTYDWTGMAVELDQLQLLGEIAYRDGTKGGYELLVLASNDGKKWQKIGGLEGDDLPGEATVRRTSTDPNKWEEGESLPLRELNLPVKVKRGSYSHLRLQLNMPGCVYWRLYCNDLSLQGKECWPMPEYHFKSAWQSEGGGEQWVYVDLGADVDFDCVKLNWIAKPREAQIQVSCDAKEWKTIAKVPSNKKLQDCINCNGHGRYVRVLMTKTGAKGFYSLSEMEVMGRGGLVAQPHEREGFRDGDYYLNGGNWQLQREGDDKWLTATVPATVLGSYLNLGAVADVMFSDNLMNVSESYFNSNFTYRTTFQTPKDFEGKNVYLNFNGINWKAEIALNGHEIGHIDGAFIRGKFDVTKYLHDGDNELVVKIIRPAHIGAAKIKNVESTDLNGGALGGDNPTFHASVGWDWISTVPGRESGIWNDVFLSADGGVSVHDALVTTHLNGSLASVSPSVLLSNNDSRDRKVTLKGWIGDIRFEKEVSLQAGATTEVTFPADDFAQLKDQALRLWWPNGYGEPFLYDAGFAVVENGRETAHLNYKAGIREMSYTDLDTDTQIFINGKRFNPLGGNWGFSEMNLNFRGREYDTSVKYHRDMNYNMIRNWVGQIGDEEFYDACDKYGIMVWQDFWLANPWDGPDPFYEDMFLANSKDYILRIRNHASVGIYVGRNEGFPPETIDRELRRQIKAHHPQLGYIPSSADEGVSGHGPYRMLPIDEYFSNQTHKIHSERGMPNVPTYESLCRMLAPEDLWPQSIQWGKHDYTMAGAQQGRSFNNIIEKRFGASDNAEDFCRRAQLLNYDGYRAMYESSQQYRRGLLIWMSHSCWPSMVWDTYDYYFEPTGAFFGVKKACEPLHIQYNPVKDCVEVVNMVDERPDLEARMQVLDLHGKVLSEKTASLDAPADSTIEAMKVGIPQNQLCYVRLYLSENGNLVSENFYIENTDVDNFRDLLTLPKPALQSSAIFRQKGCEVEGTVEVSNPTDEPAILIRVNLKGNDGEQILPVDYSDNYFHLMPGEKKIIKVGYKVADSRGADPTIEITTL